jgi:hypothetical protein
MRAASKRVLDLGSDFSVPPNRRRQQSMTATEIASLLMALDSATDSPAATTGSCSAKTLARLQRIQQAALKSDYAYQPAHLTNNIGLRLSSSAHAQGAADYVYGQLRDLGREVQLETSNARAACHYFFNKRESCRSSSLNRLPLTCARDLKLADFLRSALTFVVDAPPPEIEVCYRMDAALCAFAGMATVDYGPTSARAVKPYSRWISCRLLNVPQC